MGDNLMDKVNSIGERLKIGGSEVGQKITAGMSSMSFKMKEFFQGPNQTDKLVEEATAETLSEPDWATNLELCDMINHDRINSVELIRSIKKRIMLKSARVQYLALVLLETVVKNCEKAFSEVVAERVLDEMVKLIDDPQTVVNNRNKALMLIESWGESSNELRYLPVYEETYKSLKSRGVRFPGRDNESLAPIFTPERSVSALEPNAPFAQHLHHDIPVQTFSPEQTKEAFDVAKNSIDLLSTVPTSSPQQDALQTIIETAGENEALLFEALNVNDEIQKVLSKYEDMKKPLTVPQEPEPAMIPVAVEPDESPRASKEETLVRKPTGPRPESHGGNNNNNSHDDIMDDLDEMIFGKKSSGGGGGGGGTSESRGDEKKSQPAKDDLISSSPATSPAPSPAPRRARPRRSSAHPVCARSRPRLRLLGYASSSFSAMSEGIAVASSSKAVLSINSNYLSVGQCNLRTRLNLTRLSHLKTDTGIGYFDNHSQPLYVAQTTNEIYHGKEAGLFHTMIKVKRGPHL
ncbi:target of Myb protein 1 [Striga asiatica]|uniref:Target of Myb protein 1 n=1 Tax=Striga asiatica TaxID=4170 RepID=A0A5A7QN38_STRAF|nr:target of Myb protein 1 [Striga asiatica]